MRRKPSRKPSVERASRQLAVARQRLDRGRAIQPVLDRDEAAHTIALEHVLLVIGAGDNGALVELDRHLG
jgi:hypothetical protein